MKLAIHYALRGALLLLATSGIAQATQYSLIVAGLGGEPSYEQKFRAQAKTLSEVASHASENAQVTALVGEQATREAIHRAIVDLISQATPSDSVAITLLGHGSFDGDDYRFNIPGPDITATELRDWLKPLAAQAQLLVIATSASGGALARLQSEHRIVITATKSGTERNATRFAEYWVQALNSSAADRDKNEWVTAQEAYDFAVRKVADAFKSDASLATEHARLEGKQAETFALGRLGATKEMPSDAVLIDLFAQRVHDLSNVESVKTQKASLPEDAYYDKLQQVLVTLAQTQRRIDSREASLNRETPRGNRGKP